MALWAMKRLAMEAALRLGWWAWRSAMVATWALAEKDWSAELAEACLAMVAVWRLAGLALQVEAAMWP
ncbi:UNVERIFIED_CONTAM: hypothetical protein Sangu_1186200 [Sesamum angustifolium]|uniref:Uncharacterized protein n=1 Tax=Sesamum angustifolium TaxID=2727405 RepID=A0AAW2NI66_9LAMI